MALVIKYGGNAMTDDTTRVAVAAEIRSLHERGEEPVVVHGGGPFIRSGLDEAGLSHHFVRGLRVTSDAALEVVERVLTLLGKRLAQDIGPAIGLTGRDAGLLRAVPLDPELGRVGSIDAVDTDALRRLLRSDFVPVLACLGLTEDGQLLNVNADDVAGAVAGALGVGVVFLTNVPGVLDDADDATTRLPLLSRSQALARIADGRINGGMIPKVEAGLRALDRGSAFAVIADGRDAKGARAALRLEGGTRLTADD